VESEKRGRLEYLVGRYDRIARFYRLGELLFLILPGTRRRAVEALHLDPGDVVLELGAGTGRNLARLVDAVGPTGHVIAVDASPGMLAQASRLVERHGWSNVELLHQDAAELDVDSDVDAVLFSLSYSVIPQPRAALERSWTRLRRGGRVVVMDAGLTQARYGGLLRPVVGVLLKLGPGDPYSRPWEDLARYAPVTTERLVGGLYFICSVAKGAET
jgi:ubiquinone/menaquinone biosynthesis C-methylase UbiE